MHLSKLQKQPNVKSIKVFKSNIVVYTFLYNTIVMDK